MQPTANEREGAAADARRWPKNSVTNAGMVFISHASEDGDTVAVPLAERLRELGLTVWLDQWELTLA